MFTKNIKTISILALVAVVVLVVSVLIAIGNDSKVEDALAEQSKSYEQKIEELNKTIEDLNKGLISANEALEALKNLGIELKEWEDATAALLTKVAELEKVEADFYAETEKKNDKLSFADYYGNYLTATKGEDGVYTIEARSDIFEELYNQALSDLKRATTVAEMDSIIADYKKSLGSLSTDYEKLVAIVDKFYEKTITLADVKEIETAYKLYGSLKDAFYAENEKKEIGEKLNAIYADVRPLAVDRFVALVNALPEVELLSHKHTDALKDNGGIGDGEVVAAKKFVEDLYAMSNVGKDETPLKDIDDYQDACETYDALVKRAAEIAEYVEWVNGKEADKDDKGINGTINTLANKTFIANMDTKEEIEDLKDTIQEKLAEYGIIEIKKSAKGDEIKIVNQDLYDLIDNSGIATINSKWETVTAELKADAEKFINAVKAIDSKITLDSLTSIQAAQALCPLNPEYVDEILGYTKEGVLYHNQLLGKYRRTYTDIDTDKKTLENFVIGLLNTTCSEGHGVNDKGEAINCDCKKNENWAQLGLNDDLVAAKASDIDDYEAIIVRMLGDRGLDESVFNETLLSFYKKVRVYRIAEAAKKNIKSITTVDGLDDENVKGMVDNLVEHVDNKVTTYSFKIKATTHYVKDDQGKDTTVVDYISYSMDDDTVTEYLKNFDTVEKCKTWFEKDAAESNN